ncbi:MAG TPA: hypothetical protein VGB92_20795 [Longimicrobium sp.]|jgi:hypothetical protein
MTKKTIRTVQPAHKSDKVTVAQAKKAWLEVARNRSASPNDARSNVKNDPNSASDGSRKG